MYGCYNLTGNLWCWQMSVPRRPICTSIWLQKSFGETIDVVHILSFGERCVVIRRIISESLLQNPKGEFVFKQSNRAISAVSW